MDIDLETALRFIRTGFHGFTDVIRASDTPNENGVYEFRQKEYAIFNWDRICRWTHHDLSDSTVVESLRRRADRLLSSIHSPSTLLLYYDKVTHPIEHYRDIIDPFTKEYPCRILVIGPAETAPVVIYQSESLCIVSGNMGFHRLLNYLYTFNILPRVTSRSIHPASGPDTQ
jgi:hypothetical protein